MSQGNILRINEIKTNLTHFLGQGMGEAIADGRERITSTSKPGTVAKWVKGTMEQLDQLVNAETKNQIMQNCGHSCALVHKRDADKMRALRKQFQTEDEFFEDIQRNPSKGVRYVKEGDLLYQIYEPHALNLRCYCSLLRGLPKDETVSLTYCQCSKGFVETTWEIILERKVQVDLLESCVHHGNECKFAIHLEFTHGVDNGKMR